MDALVLGGTRFVGRHIVEAALAAGWRVAVFHRGQSNPGLFKGRAECIVGDRETDLGRLDGRAFDAVIDTCAYFPRHVEAAADALGGRAGRYLLISSISVYHDPPPGAAEDADIQPVPETIADQVDSDSYGYLKALCERAARRGFGNRAAIVRPGLVAGPWDPTDRFTYWPAQFDSGLPVLAPEPGGQRLQYVDARDLARFVVGLCEAGDDGVYHVAAPSGGRPFQDLIAECHEQTGSQIMPLTREDQDKFSIQDWMDWPLFHSDPDIGWNQLDCSRAEAKGFRARPLAETVADTLAWYRTERPAGPLRAGLPMERIEAILAELLAEGGVH